MSYKYKQCPSCFELSVATQPACPFCAGGLRAAEYHPSRRFFARLVDFSVLCTCWFLIAGVVLLIVFPSQEAMDEFQQSAQFLTHPLLSYPLMGALMIFGEAFILTLFGNTPGKMLYGIQLIYAPGDTPGFRASLKRTFMVWTVGMGVGFPLAFLYLSFMARKRLSKTGVTLWDADGGFYVKHQPLGVLRMFGVIVISLLACLLMLGIFVGG